MMSDALIWASWLIDGSARQALSDVLIEINRGRITSIKNGVNPPDGIKETNFFSFDGCTIIPALIEELKK
jgi:dihydroorotase-like cyclic amidohydrolase